MLRCALSCCVLLAACGSREDDKVVSLDGSSTVFPISEAVAEELKKSGKGRVTVGMSGTGGGFEKLCRSEVPVIGASRPIKPEEQEACRRGGVEFIELPVAYDGISIVVHPSADWIESITIAELRKMWEPQAQDRVMRWSDVREGWPDSELHLFGAGVDSGTYDYFTLATVGAEHSSRGDYTASEDDNTLVQGIASDKLALGFTGYAYYYENRDKLALVPVDDGDASNGDGPIAPSFESVLGGTYQPLSRPIFLYVSQAALARDEVVTLVDFYLQQCPSLAREVGYMPLPDDAYDIVRARFAARTLGSAFGGRGSTVGITVERLLRAD
ncbi:MAG: PstS family phosphate ABC transporter substrate-binding protein [Deltaproteobacteria bacterium]|nr:PstS family phosphate ABC transporter substrate-binding protein [Nannocystaceae bacterium]